MKISGITAHATATATAKPSETDDASKSKKSPFIFDQTPVTKPAKPKGDGPARHGAALLRS